MFMIDTGVGTLDSLFGDVCVLVTAAFKLTTRAGSTTTGALPVVDAGSRDSVAGVPGSWVGRRGRHFT